MKRAVQRRPQELGHAGIEDGEVAGRVPGLEIDHLRDEHACRPDDRAAWLDHDRQTVRTHFVHEGGDVFLGRHDSATVVGDAQSAAEVQVFEPDARAAKLAGEAGGKRRRVSEGAEGGDLRADVHVNRHECQPPAAGHGGQQLPRLIHWNAELVDLQTGRDVRVSPRVDVGVDADGHAGRTAGLRGDGLHARELARRLDVDGFESERHRALELGGRLPHAGEHDLGGGKARAPGDLDFPDRVGIDRAPELPQQLDEGERRVGLERVVQRVGIRAKRPVDRSIPLANRRGAVHVGRRAHVGGDGRQRYVVADELGTVLVEADHGSR